MEAKKISSTMTRVMGNDAVGAIDFDGFKWKMGATTGANIEYLYDLDDLVKNAHLFIRTLLPQTEGAKIAVSIPAEAYYSSQQKEDGGMVQKFKQELLRNIPGLSAVRILPQGASAFQYLAKEKKIDITAGNTLVIDGGFNTVNVSIIRPDGSMAHTETIPNEIGIYNLLMDFFRTELQGKYEEVSPNAQILKKIFLCEVIDNGFKQICITNEKQRAINAFIAKLISRITSDIKKKHLSFDQFVFVGGVSYYINKEAIETTKPFYIPTKNGEFLTVMGMKQIADSSGENYSAFDVGFGDTKYILADASDSVGAKKKPGSNF